MDQQFKFKEGARVKGDVSAQAVGEELDRITTKYDGNLTPAAVVDESRPADAELHPCFTWDDSVAAEEYRKVEARQIVRSVEVVIEAKPPEPAFINVRVIDEESEKAGQHAYKRAREVVQDIDLYDCAFRDAQARLASAAKAIEDLERMAREYVSDERIAQAETITKARSKVTEAGDLLATI